MFDPLGRPRDTFSGVSDFFDTWHLRSIATPSTTTAFNMAAQDVSTTATDVQGDARRRNVGQPNGSYIPKEVGEKMEEKTKQKVDLWTDSRRLSMADK